jgi:hypothetical protein
MYMMCGGRAPWAAGAGAAAGVTAAEAGRAKATSAAARAVPTVDAPENLRMCLRSADRIPNPSALEHPNGQWRR